MHDVRYRLIRRVEGDLVLLVVQDVRLSVDNVMPLCLHSVRLPLTGRDVEGPPMFFVFSAGWGRLATHRREAQLAADGSVE